MKSLKNFYIMLRFLKMDLNRYTGQWWNPIVLIAKAFVNPGMTFSIWYRFERYLLYESNIVFKLIGYLFYPLYFFVTYYVLSYHIEPQVKIGGGLLLHNRDIIMTENVEIGKYFTCMGQVTIGKDFDVPEEAISVHIKDHVMVGVGAKIIASGELIIEDRVIIGANAVVIKN